MDHTPGHEERRGERTTSQNRVYILPISYRHSILRGYGNSTELDEVGERSGVTGVLICYEHFVKENPSAWLFDFGKSRQMWHILLVAKV